MDRRIIISWPLTSRRRSTQPRMERWRFSYATWGSQRSSSGSSTPSFADPLRIVTAHGPTPSIRLHRGLRQGSAESAVLYLLVLEPLLRSLASKAQGHARHVVPPLVQAYCDDLLLIAHSLPQFLEYAAAITQYLADMGMSLNVSKYAYTTTARIPSIMVCLNPGNAAPPWVCLPVRVQT